MHLLVLLDPTRVNGALATIGQKSVGLVGALTLLQTLRLSPEVSSFSFFARDFLPDDTWT